MLIFKKKVAIFISGKGSNLKNIYKFSKTSKSKFDVTLVVSNKKKAKGLVFSRSKKLRTIFIDKPTTAIDTAALAMIPGVDTAFCRTTEIISDSAYIILNRLGKDCSGNFFIDDEVLASEGIVDLDKYAVVPGTKEFIKDLYVD